MPNWLASELCMVSSFSLGAWKVMATHVKWVISLLAFSYLFSFLFFSPFAQN